MPPSLPEGANTFPKENHMRTSCLIALCVAGLATSLAGCGGSFQSEEQARELIEKEDAAMDIEAEIAAEKADAE